LADVGAILHGDDSEVVLLVDPHQEGLVVVVEDTTSLGPLSLEAAGLEVLVTTLEEEVISDQLLLLGFSHGCEGVVLALELALERLECLDDLGLECKTLLLIDGGAEREVSEVTSDTDTGRIDHSILVSREVGAVQLLDVHGGDVLIVGAVAVVSLNDLVHEGGKVVVGLVGATVDTDTGVGPFAAGEDALSEGETVLVLSILALFPDITGEALREQRCGA